MSEAVDDLRATSEAIVADAERLQQIEERKQTLEGGDPELKTLSAEAEQLARAIVPKTVAQRELASEAADAADAAEAADAADEAEAAELAGEVS